MNYDKYPILRRLKNKETMSAAMFWSEFFMKVISYFCAVILMVIVLSVVLDLSTEKLSLIAEYVAIGMIPLWCIPIARNTKCRLRDAGYTAKAYLWLLLPVVGWAVFIVLMCAKSQPRKPDGTFLNKK